MKSSLPKISNINNTVNIGDSEELLKKTKYYSFVNDVVLDPFGGIGTTAIAAHKNNRRFVSYELAPKYVKILEQYLITNKVSYDQKVVDESLK